MLDIGWSELLVIGMVALIVVGPKELPRMLRTAGQWVGRAKSVARDFQRSMDEAAREADLDEFKDMRKIASDISKARIDTPSSVVKSFTDPVAPPPSSAGPSSDAPAAGAPSGDAPPASGAATETPIEAPPAAEPAPEPKSA